MSIVEYLFFALAISSSIMAAQIQGGSTPPQDTALQPPVVLEQIPQPFDKYPLGPDSLPQPGVPKGKTFHFEMTQSKTFPSTTRNIFVYVPAEYRGDKPACTFVFLDGIGFNAQNVFDNLIARHAMPVTIAIGVSPGTVDSSNLSADPRFDRSMEFDSMTDRFARFLIDEVIPTVEKQHTPDGLPIRLSNNPDDRAIAGGSTGGIGSFTVAWQHPEAFHRVFTAIGTFVGMRGGQNYYVLVRKTEPKPIRVFMQDGMNDEWRGAEMGDWWMSNATMSRALEFAGYDVRHIWGAGTHTGTHADSIFPEVVQWLWRDWPSHVVAKSPENRVLKAVLQSGENWNVAVDGCGTGFPLAADVHGTVLYLSRQTGQPASLDARGDVVACATDAVATVFAVGPDNAFYQARSEGGIEVFAAGAREGKVLASGRALQISSLVVRSNNDVYATTVTHNGQSDLWLIPARGEAKILDQGLKDARGLAISPDGLWLFVSQHASRFGLSYRIERDGTLNAGEPFYDFEMPADADDSGATQVAMDTEGRPWVATRMGIQIFDRNGRVAAILPLPGNAIPTGICFGGPDFDTLFVAAGGRIYKRKLREKGVPPWALPVTLPPWSAG